MNINKSQTKRPQPQLKFKHISCEILKIPPDKNQSLILGLLRLCFFYISVIPHVAGDGFGIISTSVSVYF